MCILLAEDEFLTREVEQMVLQDAGFEVLAVEQGDEACEHIRNFPGRFSGLITDFRMPGTITGRHVIELMRPLYPRIPIILATAYVNPVTGEWLGQHSVHLLAKPFAETELLDELKRLLH